MADLKQLDGMFRLLKSYAKQFPGDPSAAKEVGSFIQQSTNLLTLLVENNYAETEVNEKAVALSQIIMQAASRFPTVQTEMEQYAEALLCLQKMKGKPVRIFYMKDSMKPKADLLKQALENLRGQRRITEA